MQEKRRSPHKKRSAGGPPSRRDQSEPAAVTPRTRWSGLDPLLDAYGNERKRFFKLETLANATDYFLRRPDAFIVASVQDALGPFPVTALAFELFLETPGKLVFRARATNAKGRQGTFSFVVAKNDDPYSGRLAIERASLWRLYQQIPKLVLKPLRGGTVYLPDRHGRSDQGRSIYGYMAEWPSGFHEIGVGKNGCFFIQGQPPQPVTAEQTETIKARMAALVAATFHERRRDCIEIPDIDEADFLASRPQQGAIRLKLVTCRGVLKHMTPEKVLHRIADASYAWRGRRVPLLPRDSALFLDELSEVLGAEEALGWLRAYHAALTAGRIQERPALTAAALDMLGI